jgi:hypothetical protein
VQRLVRNVASQESYMTVIDKDSASRRESRRLFTSWARDSIAFLACIALAAILVTACGGRVPEEVQPTLTAVRGDAHKVAELAAAACATQFTSGRFVVTNKGCSVNKLPGEDLVPIVPSPAKGTLLESNAGVLEVLVTCGAPTTGNQSCGSSLAPLRGNMKFPGANRTRKTVEGNCNGRSTDCEEVIAPSQNAHDEKSADLRIVKPVIGGPAGATVEVTVILAK